MTVYGHIDDNNLHLLVSPRPWSEEAKSRVQEMVYRPLVVLGGSVSAEHGIGLHKREWLSLSRSAEELSLMRCIKAALDPHNLLNRGKIL
ncbi:FAD-linked oxidase C-terminal domain-containing protein [Bradyrhizobium valentinum]|uniref:FAD-linked oxidase C-terminal domain-containing protein n=1 Tax=Bradyrhizobium valentinum TaxID=1518501 RepID=UPI000B146E9B